MPYTGPFLPKEQLEAGVYYYGKCRNATVARWDGEKFHHWRTKFNRRFIETIKHPDDEQCFDVFYPISVVDFGCDEIPLPE